MPRRQTRNVTKRRRTDPRNTFDFSTPNLTPQARPVDPYVQPNTRTKAQELAQALGIVGDTMKQLEPHMREYAQQQYEQGRIAALTGEEKPSKGYYKITAYEEAEGQVTAQTKYKQALKEFYREAVAKELDPEEFQEGLENIINEFLKGRTDNFIRGFAPKAETIEQTVAENYNNYLAEKAYEKSLNIVGGLADTDIGDILNNAVSERLGEHGVTSLDDLSKNPSLYQTIKNDNEFRQSLSTALRKQLTELQQRGKAMDLPRKAVSAQFIQYLGRYAVRHGMPEVLDMAYEMDKDGVSLAKGELSQTIESFKEQAQNARRSLITASQRAAEERYEENQKVFFNQTYASLNSLLEEQDPEERAKKVIEMQKAFNDPDSSEYQMFWSLDTSKFRILNDMMNEMVSSRFDFPDESDEQAYMQLFEAAQRGSLSYEALQDAKQQSLLSLNNYKELTKMVIDREQRIADEAEKRNLDRAYNTIDNAIDFAVEQQLGNYTKPADAAALRQNLQEGLEIYKDQHGRYPEHGVFVDEILNPWLKRYHNITYGELRSSVSNINNDIVNIDPMKKREEIPTTEEVQQYLDDKNSFDWLAELWNWKGQISEEDLKKYTGSDADWKYTTEQSYSVVDNFFKENDSFRDVYEALWKDLGQPTNPASVEYYLSAYLNNWASTQIAHSLDEGNMLEPTLEALKTHLVDKWGVPEEVAMDILYDEDGTLPQNTTEEDGD